MTGALLLREGGSIVTSGNGVEEGVLALVGIGILVDVGKKYVQGKDEPEQLTLR